MKYLRRFPCYLSKHFGRSSLLLFIFVLLPLSSLTLGNKFQLTEKFKSASSLNLIEMWRLELGFLVFLLSWSAILLVKTRSANHRYTFLVFLFIAPLLLISSYGAMVTSTLGKTYSFDFLVYAIELNSATLVNEFTATLVFIVIPFCIFAIALGLKIMRILGDKSISHTSLLKRLLVVFGCSTVLGFAPPLENQVKVSNTYNSLAYLWVSGVFPHKDTVIIPDAKWRTPKNAITYTKENDFHDRNVVLILLESVRSRSTSLHPHRDGDTTPFLAELAKTSIIADRAITMMPHSSKALVAINCGIEPFPGRAIFESTLGLPAPCLPEILNSKGYDTAFFSSSLGTFENRHELMRIMGYQDFFPMESLPKKDFEMVNYFGYEDDIMLEPSYEWIEQRTKPFYMVYFTGMSHHAYTPPSHFENIHYSENETLNDYLNSIRYADEFIEKIISHFKGIGLYEDTIFVITGDHGEGFGEHYEYLHNSVIYQEGIHIPLIIHSKESRKEARKIAGASSQIDIMPTILNMLKIESNHQGSGQNILDNFNPVAHTICWHDNDCVARIDSQYSYHYYFGYQREGLYDLIQDPLEMNNLATTNQTLLEQYRKDTLDWYHDIKSKYHHFYSNKNPDYLDTVADTYTPGSYDALKQYRAYRKKLEEKLKETQP